MATPRVFPHFCLTFGDRYIERVVRSAVVGYTTFNFGCGIFAGIRAEDVPSFGRAHRWFSPELLVTPGTSGVRFTRIESSGFVTNLTAVDGRAGYAL